jgi:hypothetical protein
MDGVVSNAGQGGYDGSAKNHRKIPRNEGSHSIMVNADPAQREGDQMEGLEVGISDGNEGISCVLPMPV